MKFIIVGKNISALLQKGLPPKWKDLGIFSIPCKLGDLKFSNVKVDLGASVNVLLFSVFEKKNENFTKD